MPLICCTLRTFPMSTISQPIHTSSTVTQKPSVQTSLVDVTELVSTTKDLPCRILLKNELEQPSGSFKLRGIGHLIHSSIIKARLEGKTEIEVFASSGGNAGLAAAYSAQFYNVPCTVVVPTFAMPQIVEKLKLFGAKVVLKGKTISEADKNARKLMTLCDSSIHTIYCHPFDHPLIWEGHSQMIDEIFDSQLTVEEAKKLRGVICSVGGGGLYNGIMKGLKDNGSGASCLLLETKQAPTLSESIRAGSVITLNSVNSVATSLACSYVSPETLEMYNDQSTNKSFLRVIDDLDAVRGSIAFHKDFNKVIEPACGAAVSVVYNQIDFLKNSIPDLAKDDIVVVVVCGGSCTNDETLNNYNKMLRKSRL